VFGFFGDHIIGSGRDPSRYGCELCVPESPGFPGSAFSAVFQVAATVHDVGRQFQQSHAGNASRIADAAARFESRLNSDRRPSPARVDELASLTASLNSAAGLAAKDARRLLDGLWPRYAQILAMCRAGRPSGGRSPDSKFQAAPGLLKGILESFGALGDQICRASGALQNLCRRVDYASDFRRFIARADLKFVDVTPPPFGRFTFASRYCAPDVRAIAPFTMPYFPSHVAVAKADFAAESPDELPLRKGQRLYLMQTPRGEWAFAMAPARAVYGWVPSSFVQVRGIGIAVVLDRQEASGFRGRRQAILVLLEVREEGANVLCEDAHGNQFVFNRKAVAIL
jgi:hypothetical protein